MRNLLTNTEVIGLDYRLIFNDIKGLFYLQIDNLFSLETNQLYSFDFLRKDPSGLSPTFDGIKSTSSIFLMRSMNFGNQISSMESRKHLITVRRIDDGDRLIANLSDSQFSTDPMAADSQLIQQLFILNGATFANYSLIDQFKIKSNCLQLSDSIDLSDLSGFNSIDFSVLQVYFNKLNLRVFKIVDLQVSLKILF